MHATESKNTYPNNFKKATEFLSKISHTILRYRVESALAADFVFSQPAANAKSPFIISQKRSRTKSEILKNSDNSPLHNRTVSEPTISLLIPRKMEELELILDTPLEFWKNGVPIHVDVISKDSFLLERWVLSFQSSSSLETYFKSAMHRSNNYFSSSLDIPSNPQTKQVDDGPALFDDMTDLILLIQSLYAEIRSLPLASYLERKVITKGDLHYSISFGNGDLIRHSSPFELQNTSSVSGREFHPNAKLCVFKFRPVTGSKGILCLHVLHDLNLAGLSKELSFSPSTTPTDEIPSSLNVDHLDIAGIDLNEREQKRAPSQGSIISAGSFSVSIDSDKGTRSSLELPATNLTDHSGVNQVIFVGSPFPSPKAQKRVLAFSQSRNEPPTSLSNRSNIPLIRVRSNLHFNFSTFESPLDGDGETDADGEQNQGQEQEDADTRMKILTPDGIEIHRSIGSQSPTSISPKNDLKSFEKRSIHRRDSVPSTASDLFGTFVGSYEESILIGRLSTTPSRPILFLAEIGVLAIGKCKPSLKCPLHLSVGFSAYFYQLPDEDIPTPYVGTIDMNATSGKNWNVGSNEKVSVMPKECLGYRLPLKGQLQIMIKNPSCTAIKIFLIPYDFRDMPPNTKTFIRQKSYAISNNSNSTSINSPSPPLTPNDQEDRSILVSSDKSKCNSISPDRLKFATHLHFQMNSKKSLYLTSQVRVVFSSRPLDGDEKLKIVYQAPNFPKYQELSPYTMSSSPTHMWHTSSTSQETSHVQGR